MFQLSGVHYIVVLGLHKLGYLVQGSAEDGSLGSRFLGPPDSQDDGKPLMGSLRGLGGRTTLPQIGLTVEARKLEHH